MVSLHTKVASLSFTVIAQDIHILSSFFSPDGCEAQPLRIIDCQFVLSALLIDLA